MQQSHCYNLHNIQMSNYSIKFIWDYELLQYSTDSMVIYLQYGTVQYGTVQYGRVR